MDRKAQRFKLVPEFDGRRYSGWQKQDDARTIQGSLLKAAGELYGNQVDVQGNGRTDGGVHALQFVAHLEAATDDAPHEVARRMNALLPHDINILKIQMGRSPFSCPSQLHRPQLSLSARQTQDGILQRLCLADG